MARIVFPTTFSGWIKLFTSIRQKHIDDDTDSILIPYFTQHEIDIEADEEKVEAATDFDTNFDKESKEAKKLYEQCVNKLDKVVEDHRLLVGNLKKFYRKSITTLGDWDVTVVGNKIIYPSDRDELCKTIKKFIDKHNTHAPGASPISATFLTQNEIDLVANYAALPVITELNKNWVETNKDAEELRENRDVKMAPVIDNVRGTANFIVSQFPKTPKTAGDWGLVIDDSPQAAKLKTLKVKEGAIKVIYQVVAGSIIQNVGNAVLILSKGQTGTGTPISLNPGEHWQVAKGYTVITVKNPSLTEKSALQYMKN